MKAALTAAATLALFGSVYAEHVDAQVQPLPASGGWDYQLYGRYQSDPRVTIVSSNAGVSADPAKPASSDVAIDTSLYNICYLNVFQTQKEDNNFWAANYPQLILMNGDQPVEDTRWPGEYLFDISTAEKRTELLGLQQRWLGWCRDAGFQAVEPDNIDSYERSNNLLTTEHAFEFMKEWAAAAHALGLAVAQKNSVEWVSSEGGSQPLATGVGFDFALVEECQLTNECAALIEYYGPERVLEVEYWYDTTDTSSGATVEASNKDHFVAACTDHGSSARIVLRNRDVRPAGQSGFVFELCGDNQTDTAEETTSPDSSEESDTEEEQGDSDQGEDEEP